MNTSPVMVVTGSSKGIGRIIAEHFLLEGYSVFGCSRGETSIEDVNYHHSRVDVSDEKQVREWIRAVKKIAGRVDVLVSNAGILESFLPMTVTPGTILDSFLKVNIAGTFYVCREVAKIMVLQQAGSIITLSSIMTQLHEPGTAAYSASKAAITEMTKVLARELAPMGVTCNVIAPSMMITEATNSFGEKWANALLEKQTIKRPVTAEELCNVVSFFASESSRCITGQVVQLGLVS